MNTIAHKKQTAYRCTECRQPVGRRPEGTKTAYCWTCDRMRPVTVNAGRR